MTTKGDQNATAAGVFNSVGDSQTKLPDGVLGPNVATATGANPQFDLMSTETAAAAGIPNRYGDSITAGGRAGVPNIYGDSIATKKPVDANIPEGVMKPNMITTGAESALQSTETVSKNPNSFRNSTNIAAGEPIDASGKKLAEEHATIPEGIMQPKGANPQANLTSTRANPNFSGDAANITAGEPVDASGQKSGDAHVKIPESIMKPKDANPQADLTSSKIDAGNPNRSGGAANITAGEPVDVNGQKAADGHVKLPDGIMSPTISGHPGIVNPSSTGNPTTFPL